MQRDHEPPTQGRKPAARWTALLLLMLVGLVLPNPGTSLEPAAVVPEDDGDLAGTPVVFAELADAADPTSWTTDPSGAVYRAATLAERVANEWPPGAFLVRADAALRPQPGAASAPAFVPLVDGDPALLELPLAAVKTGVTYATTFVDGETVARVPTFHVYESATDGGRLRLVVDDLGAFSARGQLRGAVVDLIGPEPNRVVDPIDDGSGHAPDGTQTIAVVLTPAEVAAQPSAGPVETPAVALEDAVGPVGDAAGGLAELGPTSHCNLTGVAAVDAVLHTLCILAGIQPQCSDGLNNDGDAWTDYPSDPGCSSSDDNSEAPNPACSDGIDNDSDRWTDYPNDPGCTSLRDTSESDSRFTNNFGLFGEMKWCTRFSSTWSTLNDQPESDINAGFDGNGGTRADLVSTFLQCWVHPSGLASAQACANSGGCSDGSGHSYPYNSCGSTASCYRDNAWADVTHARLHNSFSGLKVVHVSHDGTMTSNTLCGLSRFHPGGDSVALGPGTTAGTGCKEFTWTHEVGHSFDAVHEDAVSVGTCHTVMKPSAESTCRVNYFSDANRKNVNDCVVLSSCPRSGTG